MNLPYMKVHPTKDLSSTMRIKGEFKANEPEQFLRFLRINGH